MIEIEKPRIERVEASDSYGKFVVEPLEHGFGQTLGNSLRRVLLSSLPGVEPVWPLNAEKREKPVDRAGRSALQ